MMSLNDYDIRERLVSPAPCNILLVDDDDLIRAQLASMLKRAGYRVRSAGSGEAALAMLDVTPCQIVLTDWEMPHMDGPSLCRALKLRESEPYTYVVMLSVRGSAADILAGVQAGVDDYLVKGTPPKEFLARIEIGRAMTHLAHSLRVSSTGPYSARTEYEIN